MKYSADASAFIVAWNDDYPPDVFPDIWKLLERSIKSGDLRATEEVLKEIEQKDDDVCKWAQEHSELFVSIDEVVQEAARDILKDHPDLIKPKLDRPQADPYVIALAKINGASVVTNEKPNSPDQRKITQIPSVCSRIQVPCIRLIGMMREQGWRFIRACDYGSTEEEVGR